MPALPYKLALLALLALAGNALLLTSAEGAIRKCDRRILPRADRTSVEAAARAATGGKLSDIHVNTSCIVGVSTSVWLETPKRERSGNAREWWALICDREPSTWSKRGGWKCAEPTLTREIDAKATFRGLERTLLISSEGTIPFDVAEGLARRALTLFEDPPPGPPMCGSPDAQNDAEWKKIRASRQQDADQPTLDVSIEHIAGTLRVQPLGSSAAFAFEFREDAVADPGHAPACWMQVIVVD